METLADGKLAQETAQAHILWTPNQAKWTPRTDQPAVQDLRRKLRSHDRNRTMERPHRFSLRSHETSILLP